MTLPAAAAASNGMLAPGPKGAAMPRRSALSAGLTSGIAWGGNGGNSYFGGGVSGTVSGGAAVAGTNGTVYGGGASGASVGPNASTAAGGVGGKGIVVITEYVIA